MVFLPFEKNKEYFNNFYIIKRFQHSFCMYRINLKPLCLLISIVFTTVLTAQTQLWQSISAKTLTRFDESERVIKPQKAFSFSLAYDEIKKSLVNAPLRFSEYDENNVPVINLPTPDGESLSFKVLEAPTFHPALQRQYLDIRSYVGQNLRNPHIIIRFSIDPENGLSAMILGDEEPIFIDAYAKNQTLIYNSYYKKDFTTDKILKCGVDETQQIDWDSDNFNTIEAGLRTGDGMMRKYRLALAANAEYSNYHGGTVAKVLAAMNKTITRVNGVYEKEFAITMELVPNNTSLIFFNTNTDGYTNNDGETMLTQNQNKCNAIIGAANYDIGHVFSTGGGGIASLQSPCKAATKAQGVTGSPTPVGDPFDIDYVCHEMGHQYGAEHTFNNNCDGNISTSSSYEVGSGSTIMGYAGVCSPNVQNNSDAYFHTVSVAQINTYTVNSTGNSCPQKIQTTNLSLPSVNAGNDYTIPKETPFELTGTGEDVGTPASVTYCWEQYDRETASMPPTGTATAGPLFRSLTPTKSPTRVFPPIANIVKNTKNTWEVLPKTARNINFRLTVRDNDIVGGRSNVDAMKITVAAAGPFTVSYPDTAKIVWTGGQNQTIKWDVAGTDLTPINASQVMILLSSDGGYTYPDTLAKAVANTGTATIKVPDINVSKARIKIKGVNNIFFDISNNDFVIKKQLIPSFAFSTASNISKVCKNNADSIIFAINTESIASFSNNVNLSIKSTNGATVKLSKNAITPAGSFNVVVNNIKNTNKGKYNFVIIGKSGTLSDSIKLTLELYDNLSIAPQTIQPFAYQRGVGASIPFRWQHVDNAAQYTIEISKNINFSPIDETATIADTQYISTKLSAAQVYYWRIKAINPCNNSAYTSPIIFQTSALLCDTISNTTAQSIPTTVAEINSKVLVNRKGKLADLDVYTLIDHTYLADLTTTIISPNGTDVVLFSGICNDRNNADATFDDAGSNVSCTLNTVTLKGRFKPTEALATLSGEDIEGNWTLNIKDNKAGDSGTLKTWNIRVCTDAVADTSLNVVTDTLDIVEGQLKSVTNTLLSASSKGLSADKITLRIIELPKSGYLRRGSAALSVGSTITQQEINTGALFYGVNVGATATDDYFVFETTSSKGGWIPQTNFFVRIKYNTIKVTIQQTQQISCNQGNDANIEVSATGGTAPYQYSLNNGAYQNSNTFSMLSEGNYEVKAKDADGFTAIQSISIVAPEALLATTLLDSNKVTIQPTGGTPPYEINFNNNGFGTNSVFDNLTNATTYLFSVKDSKNCQYNGQIYVSFNTINATLSTTNPKCNGSQEGAIIVNVTGGKPPFQYTLNSGTAQNSSGFLNLGAGTYTITVKDSDNFTRSVVGTLTNPTPLSLTIKSSWDTLFLITTGGTPPYQYSIDNGVTFQSNAAFAKTPNGAYTLVVKDANGCRTSQVFQFTKTTEWVENNFFGVSPNPTSDELNINLKATSTLVTNLTLYNLQGQEILQEDIKAGQNTHQLNVNFVETGLYILALKNKAWEQYVKVMILK